MLARCGFDCSECALVPAHVRVWMTDSRWPCWAGLAASVIIEEMKLMFSKTMSTAGACIAFLLPIDVSPVAYRAHWFGQTILFMVALHISAISD